MYYVGLTDLTNIDLWSTSIYLSLCPSIYLSIYLYIYIAMDMAMDEEYL